MSGPGYGSVSGVDPFEHDDAAYLLGALDSADRAAFESHLSGCTACTARVAALRPVIGELAAAGEAARQALSLGTAENVAPSEDRVASLARRIETRRRRTRWAWGGLASVAAATIAALAIALAAPSPGPGATTAGQQMTAIGGAGIRATAAIAAAPWGSEITIDCRYIGAARYPSGDIYVLQVVDPSGRSHQIGSWTLAQSTEARFTSGTALAPSEIRAVNVARPDGTVVLRLAG